MRRILIAFLVITAVVIGGGFIASTAYQAGLAANVAVVGAGTTGAVSGGTTVVAPVVAPGWYGPGWGWGGFPFFGFLATLFFLFLLFGMIRFLIGAGRWGRGWGHGYGPGGHHGPGGPSSANPWEARAHQTFDDWHRAAHDPNATPPTTSGPQS